MALVKCKICGKEIEKDIAYNFKGRSYCCDKDEYDLHIKNESLVKEGREIIFNLFYSKLTANNIIMLNKALKTLIDSNGAFKFKELANQCSVIAKTTPIFDKLEQSAKVKYLIAIMNNHIERVKAEDVAPEHVNTFENIEINENVTPKNNNDISFMLIKYGGI